MKKFAIGWLVLFAVMLPNAAAWAEGSTLYYVRGGVLLRVEKTVDGWVVAEASEPYGDTNMTMEHSLRSIRGRFLLQVHTEVEQEHWDCSYDTWYLLDPSPLGLGYDLIATGMPEVPTDDVLASLIAVDRIESTLMRVSDERFADLIELWNSRDLEEASVLARQLVADHPGDRLSRIAQFDTALALGDDERLVLLAGAYTRDFSESGRAFDRQAIAAMHDRCEARRMAREGTSIRALLPGLIGRSTELRLPLDQMLAYLASVTLRNTARSLDRPLIMPREGILNFLGFQVATKVARIEADFAMMQGRSGDALDLLLGTYTMAQILSRDSETLIAELIGVACRATLLPSLGYAYLDALTAPDQIRNEFPRLDAAWQEEVELQQPREVDWWSECPPQYLGGEVWFRRTAAFTHLSLLHTAAAAKYHFLETGEFPLGRGDFSPLLPDGPDVDPFDVKGSPLRFIEDLDQWTLYSIGPDKKDQQASLAYDPTNGSLSPGDIFLRIPREREYPFPSEHRLSRTLRGIMNQFPNGLPPDPFADTRGESYTVTNTDPAWIVSSGPDTDSAYKHGGTWGNKLSSLDGIAPGNGITTSDGFYTLYSEMTIEPMYDPTNGVVSSGDLFFDTADPSDRTPPILK
ncbi:hypothetical protein KQI84_05700 [bacterium]|nr:hypothetical protein [bacterium]